MKKIDLLLCCILLIFIPDLHAQREKIRFDKITIEQGLSQNSVITICQDKKGFLWFGTYDGLNRYDGFEFKVYKYNSNDSTSLIQNTIRHIMEDRFGNLWIGTEEGLSRFNREKENFTNFVSDNSKPGSISNNRIRIIYEDRSGVLWISTENGLNRYDPKRNLFIKYYHDSKNPNSISDNSVRTVCEDESGNLWIGTDRGLDLFDRKSGVFTHYKHDPNNAYSLSENIITRICEDKFGSLWIGTRYKGLNRLDKGSRKFIRYSFNENDQHSLRNNAVRGILEDRDGDLWIVTSGGGLEKYNREKNNFIHYQKDFSDPNSISSNATHCIYEDRSGIIWVGTNFGGINKFDKRKNQFVYYGSYNNLPGSLNNNNVVSFFEDPKDNGKSLWIGTWGGGLGFFDRIKNKFFFYRNNLLDKNSLSNNTIRCITKDKFGILWIGTDGGLNCFDQRTNKFSRFFYNPRDPYSIGSDGLKTIFEDRDGELWFGSNGGGLTHYDREKKRFINYLPSANDPNSINDNIVWCIREDKNGILWLGTNSGGLNSFDKKTGKFFHFIKDANNPYSISGNKILTINEDHDGMMWAGTAGGGLNKFDPATKKFYSYNINDGLASNTVHGIVEDGQNNLWISTNHGLSKFDTHDEKFTNFYALDGLQSDEFHVNSYCKSVSGEIFFGGINGFNVFKPENIKLSEYIPQIVITNLFLFNKLVPIGKVIDGRILLENSISETGSITLNYFDEVFSFQFASLDFTSPGKNLYAYRLEGFESNWNYVGNRNLASYTKLPAGRYIFKVKGSNHNGAWNENGVALEIIILPPFWKTWWFNFIIIAFVTSTIIAGYKINTARIHKKNKELEEHVRVRTDQLEEANKELEAFSYSVSHDLRAPLRAINGYSSIFLDEYGERFDGEGNRLLEVIKNNSLKMSNLINDLLNYSRIGRVEIKKQNVDMNDLVKSIIEESGNSLFSSEVDFQIQTLPIVFCDNALLKQVWQNIISNAIKFSSKTDKPRIEIGFKETGNENLFFVKDNGIGFNQQYANKLFGVFQRLHKENEFKGTGIGLAIVQRIIQRHGGRAWAEGELNIGASIYFSIPKEKNKQ